MKNRLHSERGSALLITLALLAMLALISLMAVDRSNTDVVLSHNVSNMDAAFYIAQAGAKRAFVDINIANDWRDGYASESFGGGVYTVVLTDSTSRVELDDTVIIRSEGMIREAEAWIELWTAPEY